MALKLARLSWTSPLRAPRLSRLLRLLALIQGEISRVTTSTTAAGARAARPSRQFSTISRIPAPRIRKKLPKNCISAWEKNWLILSVSLFTREIRSPCRFCAKKPIGSSDSLVKSWLRSLNSRLRPTEPMLRVWP